METVDSRRCGGHLGFEGIKKGVGWGSDLKIFLRRTR
jgi:hypothetical protein